MTATIAQAQGEAVRQAVAGARGSMANLEVIWNAEPFDIPVFSATGLVRATRVRLSTVHPRGAMTALPLSTRPMIEVWGQRINEAGWLEDRQERWYPVDNAAAGALLLAALA